MQKNLGRLPEQVLADTGFRAEAVFEVVSQKPCEVLVALGREGREQAEVDPDRYPYTAVIAARMQTESAQQAYRQRKTIVEAPSGWIKAALGFCLEFKFDSVSFVHGRIVDAYEGKCRARHHRESTGPVWRIIYMM